MNPQFEKLLIYVNKRLKIAGLTLSEFGEKELQKRFNKPESQGGFSNYWKTLKD